MFLYITLFFQNVLAFSPFEAGLRTLPVTAPILLVSPLSGRLTARVPVRLLLGTGLAFVTGFNTIAMVSVAVAAVGAVAGYALVRPRDFVTPAAPAAAPAAAQT